LPEKTKEVTGDDSVWLTLLAMYILLTTFEHNEPEWKMLALKAKTWLKD
jgi:hypothetical protein